MLSRSMEAMEYIVPSSVMEAVAALHLRKGARILAGGTDLMVQMRYGKVAPECLVDITRIPELSEIAVTDGAMRIGATARIDDIINHPLISQSYPALVAACRLLGAWQIQNMATLAGNLCNASPAAETACPLLVLDADVEIHGPAGSRLMPLHQFWKRPGQTALAPAEIVTALLIPAVVNGVHSVYQRLHIRHSIDIALVSSACRLEMEAGKVRVARLALGAVTPTPIRVREAEAYLAGRTLSEDVLDHVAHLAEAVARPISDVRATAEYRRAMSGVMARRVVAAAAGLASA